MELSHVCLMVGDLDRSLTFYSALGFEQRRTLGNGAGTSIFCGLPGDSDRLQLRLTEDFEPAMARFGHVAIEVDDLEHVLDGLAKHEVVPEQPPVSRGGRRISFVHDPDGYPIELIQEER